MNASDLAIRLIEFRSGGARPAIAEAETAIVDSTDAYAVQSLVANAVGPIGGFKTGRRPGQPQIMAPIFGKDVRRSPASFGRDEIDRIGIELEIGFRIETPLPDPNGADFESGARACVSAVAALEIVDTRLADIESASPLLRLADNQINGGLVYGKPRRDWQAMDLRSARATLCLGDEVVLDGIAEVPGGDAFETFCALVRKIGAHCGGLQPGHVVITGSLNGMPFVERGTPVRGWIDGLGEVAAEFPL